MIKSFIFGFVLGVFLVACAVGNPPTNPFPKPELWQAYYEDKSIKRLDDQGNLEIIGCESEQFSEYICMLPNDWANKLKYESLLKNSCLEWK